jgi:hypothetical protein
LFYYYYRTASFVQHICSAACNEVFSAIQRQPDGKISLDEFCEAFVASYRNTAQKHSEIETKLNEVAVELTAAQVSLSQARSTERMNPDTGISQNEHGGSLGRLEVSLVDARNLASMDYTGTSDPFVKLTVEPGLGGKQGPVCGEPSEQKSNIKWKDLNPR